MSHRRITFALRGPLVGFGILVLTLWGAVGMATGATTTSGVDLAKWEDPSYEVDGGAFGRVSLSLLDDVAGRLPSIAPPPGPSGSPLDPGEGTNPGRPRPPRGPGDPGEPALDVGITSNKQTVHPGEQITFKIAVTNVGTAAAHRVYIWMPIPEFTSEFPEDPCSRFHPPQDPNDLNEHPCINPHAIVDDDDTPSPGGERQKGELLPSLAPGESQLLDVVVYVDPDAPSGAVIVAQAHANSDEVEEVVSDPIQVRVE